MNQDMSFFKAIRKLQTPFYLCVWGNSMAPVIKEGDKILVCPDLKSSLAVGDIIVYYKFSDHFTVHRIIEISQISNTRFYCQTKGDNNKEPDPYKVFSHEIVGIVDMGGVLKS